MLRLIPPLCPRTPTLRSTPFGSIKCSPKTDQPPISPCLVACMRSLAFASHPSSSNFPSTSPWPLPPSSRGSNRSILPHPNLRRRSLSLLNRQV
ncbi:hypothetical protein K435DRAFT_46027 [Dendrothele bispora CBS 962.96]|uniref:Uncharacterized protein n=1 Tax=Dendrothele bispora (strain CBS 962.96) TaxID=1314807 RepID=A0A4S8KSU1_DENBC|nr:hypothetical protein K435DRAFT_46027 [Dendrothele bispora CBS 962.96]